MRFFLPLGILSRASHWHSYVDVSLRHSVPLGRRTTQPPNMEGSYKHGQTTERADFGSREGRWLRQGTRITSSLDTTFRTH